MKHSLLLLLFFQSLLFVSSFAQEMDTKCGTQYAEAWTGSEVDPRPTLSGPELLIETSHFIIHFTTVSVDATTQSYAEAVSIYAENTVLFTAISEF